MSAICSFISTLYLKQLINIIWFFSSVKLENSLFSNNLVRCIFRREKDLHSWKWPNKVFCSKLTSQITFLFVQSISWLCYYCHKLRFFTFVEFLKGDFHHSGNCMFLICIRLWTTTTSDQTHPLNIRKWESYKDFKIFNIGSCPWYTL